MLKERTVLRGNTGLGCAAIKLRMRQNKFNKQRDGLFKASRSDPNLLDRTYTYVCM